MTITATIRAILSVALIYGIYCETGICTAIFSLLVLATQELQNIIIKRNTSKC